jgi:hypothetical protein
MAGIVGPAVSDRLNVGFLVLNSGRREFCTHFAM